MKREFLQNLKVGDTPLSKEVIDAIMEENGKDINAAKAAAVKPYTGFDDIMAENERLKIQNAEMEADGKNARQWKEEYEKALSDHQQQLDGIAFQNVLDNLISASGGRNAKAISALLDLDALRASENRQEAVKQALIKLKAEEGYLFGEQTPPPYARGTGTQIKTNENAPTDLAGALREKFERK